MVAVPRRTEGEDSSDYKSVLGTGCLPTVRQFPYRLQILGGINVRHRVLCIRIRFNPYPFVIS